MKISVIIPCYNEEEFIGQAIGSVIEQSRPADEIIVVDDGSTDGSAAIARSFGEPVKVLSGKGEGAPKARNYGADHATGDAFMFFDADDVLGPDTLEELGVHLEKNPNGIVACPWFRLEKVNDKWVRCPRSCRPLVAEQDYLSGWIRGLYHPPCSVLWSRAAYEMTGGWDPRISVNQDGDLMMRALADGIKLHITNMGSAYYRRLPAEQQSASQSAGQFTRSGRESQIFVLRKIAQRLEERDILDKYRKSLTEALDHMRALCRGQYPDLADECNDMMNRYGESIFVRTARKASGSFRYGARLGLNRIARTMNQLGLTKTRRFLGHIKNKIWPGANKKKQPSPFDAQENEKVIKYGLTAYRNTTTEGC